MHEPMTSADVATAIKVLEWAKMQKKWLAWGLGPIDTLKLHLDVLADREEADRLAEDREGRLDREWASYQDWRAE